MHYSSTTTADLETRGDCARKIPNPFVGVFADRVICCSSVASKSPGSAREQLLQGWQKTLTPCALTPALQRKPRRRTRSRGVDNFGLASAGLHSLSPAFRQADEIRGSSLPHSKPERCLKLQLVVGILPPFRLFKKQSPSPCCAFLTRFACLLVVPRTAIVCHRNAALPPCRSAGRLKPWRPEWLIFLRAGTRKPLPLKSAVERKTRRQRSEETARLLEASAPSVGRKRSESRLSFSRGLASSTVLNAETGCATFLRGRRVAAATDKASSARAAAELLGRWRWWRGSVRQAEWPTSCS